jgi:hypothetical protein
LLGKLLADRVVVTEDALVLCLQFLHLIGLLGVGNTKQREHPDHYGQRDKESDRLRETAAMPHVLDLYFRRVRLPHLESLQGGLQHPARVTAAGFVVSVV